MAQPPAVQTPTRVLLATAGAVGASTAFIPGVTGYGTVLYQVVALGGWAIVAALTSSAYADTHDWAILSAALVLNLLLFSIPAAVIWLACRKRWPAASSGIMLAWCAFYLASLFFLFPATDGP